MSCHESLMARRRKKAKGTKSATSGTNGPGSTTTVEKALPSLPPGAATESAFSPELETPPAEQFSATPSGRRPSAQRTLRSEKDTPASSFRRDVSPLSDEARKGGFTCAQWLKLFLKTADTLPQMALPCPRVLTKKAAVRACPRSQMTARTRASSRWRSTPTPLRDRLLSPENEYLTPTTHHLPNPRRRETTLLVGRLRNRTETFCARIGHLLQDPSPQSAKAVMLRSSLAKRRVVRTSHIKRRDDRRSASRLDRTPRCRRLLQLWEALNKKGRSARRCRRLTPAPTR